jgi:hypothetical protein
MSFQEEKNINICENYYNFIKQLSEDYLKYITNYKIASIDYLKKISLNHEKYSLKLTEVDEDSININSTHIISVTSIIPKVVEQQISGLNDFLKQIDEKIINFDKLIKVKNTEFIECVSSFKDIKNELLKKYKEIDKLRANYMTNIELAEDAIHKYYIKQNTKKKANSKLMVTLDKNTEFVSLEEQANNSIQKTKKLEEEYVKNISLVKTVEKSYIDISETSIKKSTKIVCEITSYLKELIPDCLVFLNDSFKLPLVVIDTYLNEIVSLDEYTKFDDIIKSSYKNNIIFKQINPEKYTSKFFQQKNTSNNTNKYNIINIKNIINRRIKSNSMSKEDLQEMDFIQEEEKFLTVKKMLENFDLFESNKYNLDIEEEKLRCKYLTLKILSFAPKSKLYSNKITKISIAEVEEFEEMLKKKQNRVIFIQQLSQFRTRGIFDIPEKEYKILSRLFNKIAKLVESEEDFDSAINIIILSQTYYKNKNNKKEYLHNAIMNNELFKSKKFWETFIKYSIDKEIEKCKQNDKKNSKENEANYGNIAFAQLMSMINNMIEFELDINIVEEIILPIIKQYKIDPESVEAIFAPINEKKKDIKNESKNQNIQIEEKEEKLDEKIEGQKREEQKIDSKKEDEKIRIKIEGIKKEEELENEKIKNEKEIKIEENAIEMNKTEEK